jgi:tRNA nucleotidyltransferase (CCA-adding enzyme)
MDLILCHTTVDFDALGAAIGLTRLMAGAKVVLTGGAHPAVGEFLALYKDEYALIDRKAVDPDLIRNLVVVDARKRDRLGKTAEWLDLATVESIAIYDHHGQGDGDINANLQEIEPVGATTTLIVEKLQAAGIELTPAEATVMALGIHVDTGSLTFAGTTPRDARALAWLMSQPVQLPVVAQYADPGLSLPLQHFLKLALETLQTEIIWGYKLAWVVLDTETYLPGLSSLATRLVDIAETEVLLLAATYSDNKLTIVGRSQIPGVDLNRLFQPLGGGGHAPAAALTTKSDDADATLALLLEELKKQIPRPLTARELMSSPVRTIRPETTIGEAQRILLRYGHSGLPVVDRQDRLVGVISRRDIDLALHHGFLQAPVKGYMAKSLKSIVPETLLPEIESLMVTHDIGRLPVLADGQPIGIVTRTDVLRQLHRTNRHATAKNSDRPISSQLNLDLAKYLPLPLWQIIQQAAAAATARGWELYLVGGSIRDLLLSIENQTEVPKLKDIDLVVAGFNQSTDVGAGVELAQILQQLYPESRLEVHGAFQTAALLWHKHPVLDSLWIDIATARTEFYPYPAANPEVEASSIRQDLYRRDFTINALAVRLTDRGSGEVLDFFGGAIDIKNRQIKVLHPNSFIEDPTRIYRAVKFAVRLGFRIEEETEAYIRYAIESGVYERSLLANKKAPALQTRLKAELKYLLQAPYWKKAAQLLADLDAWQCLHPKLKLDRKLWRMLRLGDRWLQRLDLIEKEDRWLMRLEIVLLGLETSDRQAVATNLQLPSDASERLSQVATNRAKIESSLAECERTSQIVKLLRSYDLPTLLLVAVQSDRPIRKIIWKYLTTWMQVKPPLNGNDLKVLGYPPGALYKEILDDLLAATLDGVVSDRSSALAYLAQKYSL